MKAIAQLPEQLSIFDLLAQINKPAQAIPKIAIGQAIFMLSLDVVLCGTVERFWLCGENDKNQYYGYSIDFCDSSHNTIWDYNVGDTVFFDEQKAYEKASQIGSSLIKLNPKSLQLSDLKSFAYIRKMDNHRLTATIAKVGDKQLYEHDFMCYHFLREYANTEKRDKEYHTLLKKMSEEAEQSEACELNPPSLETLYKVDKSLYSSLGYAEQRIRIKDLNK